MSLLIRKQPVVDKLMLNTLGGQTTGSLEIALSAAALGAEGATPAQITLSQHSPVSDV